MWNNRNIKKVQNNNIINHKCRHCKTEKMKVGGGKRGGKKGNSKLIKK